MIDLHPGRSGGCYFFSAMLRDRYSRLLTEHIDHLRMAFRCVYQRQPFSIVAIVVLPEHLHAVWRLPAGDADYSGRWLEIRRRFEFALRHASVPLKWPPETGLDLWQRSCRVRKLHGEQELAMHRDYIHYNPVRHGLVRRAADWPHSSFHRYVAAGLLPEEWSGTALALPSHVTE